MKVALQNWRERPGRDPERELAKLKARLGVVSRNYERAVARRAALKRAIARALHWGKILAAGSAAGVVIWGALVFLSPWPPLVTLRHLASAPNCEAARLVGLTPSHRGEPGYWPDHDADGDGIACEPIPKWKWAR
jgi:fatty acid desaturase